MEKAMVRSLRCAWHADFNRFKMTRWAHDFTSSLLALSVLSCILFLLPILLYPCFPPEPSPHSTLLPKIWCLGLFWEAVPMFFFGYTFAGWMHLVVSSVCVLMVIAVAARALMILFIFLCGSWWKPLKNTGSLFFSTWACILIKEWTL